MTSRPSSLGVPGPTPTPAGAPDEVRLIGLRGVPEVRRGDDVAALVHDALRATGETLHQGDVLVVTHKVVSKAEGAVVSLAEVVPSELARRVAAEGGKDPRYIEVVLRESARIVRMDRGIIIAQTRHGFVCANAGVDNSNVPGDENVVLLPADPDASAARLRADLRERAGVEVAVVITDSFGRPWRNGITNVAIGVAGLAPLADYRGLPDDDGRVMSASVIAIADEIASAAELVMGKVNRCPLALIRGYAYPAGQGTGHELVMDGRFDLFR